jgi:hypothetical protein
MGAAQVVDGLRGSASAPIGWARRPPGGHTREHAWTERPIPPPARDACDQITQSRPIPPRRIRRRTPPPARTSRRRRLAPLRSPSGSGPSVLAARSPTRVVRPASRLTSRLAGRPGRTCSLRRCPRLRPTAPPASRGRRPSLQVRRQKRAGDQRRRVRRRPPRSLRPGARRTLGNRITWGRSPRLDRRSRSRSRVDRTVGRRARQSRTRRSGGIPRSGASRTLGHA